MLSFYQNCPFRQEHANVKLINFTNLKEIIILDLVIALFQE